MQREFITTSTFLKQWYALSLTDNDLRSLENFIMQNLSTSAIMEGTGGARKVRFSLPHQGKSGSIRVIYTDITHKARIHLLLCYPKSSQDNLTMDQKQQLKQLIRTLKGES